MNDETLEVYAAIALLAMLNNFNGSAEELCRLGTLAARVAQATRDEVERIKREQRK